MQFTHTFSSETAIVGSMALNVWMSTDIGDDMDVFAVVRKRDPAGQTVPFYGYNGIRRDAAAKGWLRASHRELDTDRSRPARPFHSHARTLPVTHGTPVQLNIEIWPSATLFEQGSQLVIEILGRDADRYPALRHRTTVNRGTHTVHTGGTTPSSLVFRTVPAAP